MTPPRTWRQTAFWGKRVGQELGGEGQPPGRLEGVGVDQRKVPDLATLEGVGRMTGPLPPQWSPKPSGDKVTAFAASGRPVWRLSPLKWGPSPGTGSVHPATGPASLWLLCVSPFLLCSLPAPFALSWGRDSKLWGWRCPQKWPGVPCVHMDLHSAQHAGPGGPPFVPRAPAHPTRQHPRVSALCSEPRHDLLLLPRIPLPHGGLPLPTATLPCPLHSPCTPPARGQLQPWEGV